jgi:hypothetical protein
MGRGIRRLISLFEPLEMIINEADNRLQAEADGREPQEPTTDEEVEAHEAYVFINSALTTHWLNSSERTYKAYTLLLQLVPRLKQMLEDPSIDTNAFDDFVAQVRNFSDILCVSLLLNTLRSFKRVRMMHAVTMSGV